MKPIDKNLITSDVVILETFANGSKPLEIEEDDKNCYFRNDNAALSLCKGIVSILPFFYFVPKLR